METIEERKFPLLLFISIAFIIANWLFKATTVDLLALFYSGYGIGLIFAYLLLLFKLKISLHTAAVGGLLGFLLYFSYTYRINLMLFLGLFFILGGIIGTARIKLKAHSLKEVILGFSLGVLTQFMVFGFYHII
jgi:membrane-associated phospholipid phosphatase